MKKAKIRIYAVDKDDKEKAKILNEYINYEYDKYKDIIGSIVSARMYLEKVYGLQTPEHIFNKILEEVVIKDIKDYENTNKRTKR